MKKKLIYVVVALLLAVPAVHAQSAGFKIGYVDVDYVLSQMPEAKTIESELKSYEKQLSTQLQNKIQTFQEKAKDFQENGPGMIPEVRADRQAELQEMQASIQEFQQRAEFAMQQKRGELLEPAYDKIQGAIDAVASAQGYDYILSPNVGGMPLILFAKNKDRDNISDAVLKNLGITPKPAAEGTELGN
ncbi:OmpH family outer membrane protein [Roseivirga sp. BDSF3-8]|uniref:OmpH family outer membrane protein n=1 Tax=Roseivirga sp. BDSF3-8 TaxID=3241598 RepID=UPI0035320BD5